MAMGCEGTHCRMGRRLWQLRGLALLPLLIAVSAGCTMRSAVAVPAVSPTTLPGGDAAGSWWYARFIIDWPKDSDPRWATDLLLAHQVIGPVFKDWGNDILLWRFHRRAVRDAAGHQFSFVFFAVPESARGIYGALQANPVLAALKTAQVVVREEYDDTSRATRPRIEDVSDAQWSQAVRRSWPYFAMGVSEMWLHMIDDSAVELAVGKTPTSAGELMALYQRIHESMQKAWVDEGRHAFLHHLNAFFGYEPLAVYEKRLMRF
jgi:hypothetical protein